jgi:branched-chain amino acid transport system permease protein
MAADANQPTADFRPEGAEILDEQRIAAMAGEPPAVQPVIPPDRFGGLAAASLKDSVIAAVVAFALAAPLIGLQTVPGIGSRLAINVQWPSVALIVAVVFVGRLLLNLLVWKTETPVTASVGRFFGNGRLTLVDWLPVVVVAAILIGLQFVAVDVGLLLTRIGLIGLVVVVGRKLFGDYLPALPYAAIFGGLFILGALALPIISEVFIPQQSRYLLDQAIVVVTYVMLGWGLNIVVGYAGLLDLGYVAFYAVGAYSFALLAYYFDLSFWECLPLAGLLAATWGMILGFPVLRLRGDYLAIVTVAFGEIVRLVLINWVDFTGGPNGVSNIPRPSFFGIPFDRGEGGFASVFGIAFSPIHRIIWLYYIILILALVTGAVTARLRRLPIGRAWEALREDEIACRSLGINTTNTKLTAFACGAMFAGFAGSFFATRQGFISPESFNSLESFIILAVVVLGGLGSQIGVVMAVIFLNTVFELRELEQYRMLIVGLSMVLIMVWKPRGLISTRRPSVLLGARKGTPAAAASGARG